MNPLGVGGWGGGGLDYSRFAKTEISYAFVQGIWFWLLSETGNRTRWTLALIWSGNSDAGKKTGDRLVLSLAWGFLCTLALATAAASTERKRGRARLYQAIKISKTKLSVSLQSVQTSTSEFPF